VCVRERKRERMRGKKKAAKKACFQSLNHPGFGSVAGL